MEKPITIEREEFIGKIVDTVRESHMPAFIIESILRGIADEVHMEAERQYAEDKKAYEESLSQKNTEDN